MEWFSCSSDQRMHGMVIPSSSSSWFSCSSDQRMHGMVLLPSSSSSSQRMNGMGALLFLLFLSEYEWFGPPAPSVALRESMDRSSSSSSTHRISGMGRRGTPCHSLSEKRRRREEERHSIHSLRRGGGGGGPFHSFSGRRAIPFIVREQEEEEDHSIHSMKGG